MYKWLLFSVSSPVFDVVCLYDIISCTNVYSDISFQFPNGRWSWTSYYIFICHLYILFRDTFFHVFCSFSGWLFSCFPFIFLHLQNSWYISDTSLLSDMWILNCFSLSSYCLSIFLTKSFWGKKFLILKFSLLIFAFIDHAVVAVSLPSPNSSRFFS